VGMTSKRFKAARQWMESRPLLLWLVLLQWTKRSAGMASKQFKEARQWMESTPLLLRLGLLEFTLLPWQTRQWVENWPLLLWLVLLECTLLPWRELILARFEPCVNTFAFPFCPNFCGPYVDSFLVGK
jgi:hypothetical protein